MDPVTLRRGWPLAAACAFALLAAAALGSCTNPFTPAQPELPSALTVPQDFSSVEATLATMATAMAAEGIGADAYVAAFSDSTTPDDRAYRALYDQGVYDAASPAPPPWEKKYERLLFTHLQSLQNQFVYKLSWNPDPDSPSDGTPLQTAHGDTVVIHRRYVLTAAPTADALTKSPDTLSIGRCDLSLQYLDARWSIFQWNDHALFPGEVNNPQRLCMSTHRIASLSIHT